MEAPNSMNAYMESLERKRTALLEERSSATPERQAEIDQELVALDREKVRAIPVSMHTR